MTSACQAAYRDFVADDDGFVPGLKPRPHAGSPAEFLARYDKEPGGDDPAGGAPAFDLERWERLARRLLRLPEARLPEARTPEAWTPEDLAPATGDPAGDAGPRARPSEAQEAHRRRLAEARRDLEAFAPRNAQQRELLGLLSAMLDYLEANHSAPGERRERERWWRFFDSFRRALELPEITGPRRRAAFATLVRLKAEDLLAVARHGKLARRMPKKSPRGGESPALGPGFRLRLLPSGARAAPTKPTRRRRRRCVKR